MTSASLTVSEDAGNREPLTPACCELGGLQYMPLLLRLFGSDFYALASGDEFKAGLTLWAAAFQEKPAGSLPDNEILLATKARVTLERWRELAPMALHGWTRRSDGRLYHETVALVVLDAWIERIGHRRRSAKGNATKAGIPFDEAEFDALKAQAEAFKRALDPDAPKIATSLKGEEPSLEGGETAPSRPQKPSGGKRSGGKRSEDKNPQGDSKTIFSIDDGWAIDAEALATAAELGLSEAEARAAADQHLDWWRANQPAARKPRAGWMLAWRNRCDALADDPEQRKRLKAPGSRTGFAPLAVSPPPTSGPAWWGDAGAAIAAADPLAWSTWWARATPQEAPGVVVAHSAEAARRINSGDAGIDARGLTGFDFRAIDPEDARIEALAATDPDRAAIMRRARAVNGG